MPVLSTIDGSHDFSLAIFTFSLCTCGRPPNPRESTKSAQIRVSNIPPAQAR